ncbi:hypothetical protein HDU98_002736 [Podochytrium sp. JEL0797]|nr:hypothetical protein HDU98_002736 [Podochytrium sp. JEL0797]
MVPLQRIAFLAVLPLIQHASAVVIPRFLSSTAYPITESDIGTYDTLVNSTAVSQSSACVIPSSLGVIGADSIVTINSNQLISSNMGSSMCGMCVDISYGDVQVMAVVVDECRECDDASIGISPTIYQKLTGQTSPNATITPLLISWSEVSCPTNPGIPSMSVTWGQPSSTFSSLQVYGLPYAVTQILVSWDHFAIRDYDSASWTYLAIPVSGFDSTPKQLGFWYPPDGASVSQWSTGPLALRVSLRDGSLLVTQAQTVAIGENNGSIAVGLWIPHGNMSDATISWAADNASKRRKRQGSSIVFNIQQKADYGA